MSLGELQELMMNREAWRAAIHGAAKSRTRLSDWTELMTPCIYDTCIFFFSLILTYAAWLCFSVHLIFLDLGTVEIHFKNY